jgi:hypothetical protein
MRALFAAGVSAPLDAKSLYEAVNPSISVVQTGGVILIEYTAAFASVIFRLS